MEIKNYWWEENLEKLLRDFQDNDYMSDADIKLLILKIIETEVNKIKPTSL